MRWPLLILVACNTPSHAPVANAVRHDDRSLNATLLAEVGRGSAVAIVGGEHVRAVSSDGLRERVLVPTGASWTLVDQAGRAIWYGGGAQVYAIDLDEPGVTPVLVVDGLAGTEASQAAFTIFYGQGAYLTFGVIMTPHVQIDMANGKLVADPGILAAWQTEKPFEAAVAAAKIVAPAFVAKLAKRSSGRTSAPAGASDKRVASVDPANCQMAELCGLADEIAYTKLWRVTVAHGCGDGCYRDVKLYDTTTQKFLDNDWGGKLYDAWVAPDGSAFVRSGVIYRFDRGPLPQTPGDDVTQGGGWLGAAVYYGQ
jgi:hypothetical protein